MAELGKIDCLASLDENEDPDSDNDDDDDESESDNQKSEKNGIDDLSLQIKGMGLDNDSPLLKDNLKTEGQCTEVWYNKILL